MKALRDAIRRFTPLDYESVTGQRKDDVLKNVDAILKELLGAKTKRAERGRDEFVRAIAAALREHTRLDYGDVHVGRDVLGHRRSR